MATANIYDLADTWNDGGTTFTAIKMDVTDTASATTSLLMDLRVNGTPIFYVGKQTDLNGFGLGALNGNFTPSNGFVANAGLGLVGNNSTGLSNGAIGLLIRSNQYALLNSNMSLAWGSTFSIAPDLYLSRKSAANLRLGAADAAAPVAQTLSVQGGSGTNIAGQDFTIQGSQSTGDQPGGSILFQLSSAGTAGSGQNGFFDAMKITFGNLAGRTEIELPQYSVLEPTNGRFGINAGGNNRVYFENGITVYGSGRIGFSSGLTSAGLSAATDTAFFRDDAGKMALRNDANAQEFRVYKTTTGTVYKALLGDNNLIKISGEAFTDGAGANTATLANAPAAGNPTKWIPIDDNGTTRYIPAW